MTHLQAYPNQLHVAAFDGRSTLVRSLIAEGADPNEPDEHGRTPLHWATALADKRSDIMVGVLLRRGANPFVPDETGRTPEDWAQCRHNRSALRWFRKSHSIDAARRTAQAGFTLIELLCVIAGGAAVLAGTLGVYGHVREADALLVTEASTSALVAAAERSYAAAIDFSALTTESAMAEGWLPEDGRGPQGPVNGWDKPIVLGHADSKRPDGALTLTQDVPSGGCVALIAAVGRSFNRITVNGNAVATSNPDATVAACAGGDFVSVGLEIWKR